MRYEYRHHPKQQHGSINIFVFYLKVICCICLCIDIIPPSLFTSSSNHNNNNNFILFASAKKPMTASKLRSAGDTAFVSGKKDGVKKALKLYTQAIEMEPKNQFKIFFNPTFERMESLLQTNIKALDSMNHFKH